eukprot:jgi/Psemu1/303330/fgenesh1_kg.100_\
MGYKYIKPVYTEEEIKKWKKMIYSPSNLKVDEWTSSEQDTSRVRRFSMPAKRTDTPPRAARYTEDEWMGGGPSTKKRNYRVKGNTGHSSRW